MVTVSGGAESPNRSVQVAAYPTVCVVKLLTANELHQVSSDAILVLRRVVHKTANSQY
jgi:hypothetical protein